MHRLWTDEEDEILLSHYGRVGAEWLGWERLLPNRTPSAISARARRIGIPMKARARWTPEEDEVLAALYVRKGKDWDGWKQMLPGRSPEAIRTRAIKLHIAVCKGRRWTVGQKKVLLEHLKACVEETGHSPMGCVSKMADMNRKFRIDRYGEVSDREECE